MRIAFFVDKFPSTSETFILNQITGLLDKGHTVDIYAHYRNRKTKIHPVIKEYKLLNKCHYLCWEVNDPWYKKIEMFKLAFFNTIKNPYQMLRYFKCCIKEREFLNLKYLQAISHFSGKKEKYDILCCHFGQVGMMGVLLKDTKCISGKVITFFHGNDISQYIDEKGEKIYNYLFENGDLFLPISQYWKEKLIRLGCNPQKIIVHRMGVNPETLKKSINKADNREKITILTVGRLVEKKGIYFGIQAVANLIEKYPQYPIEYLIIGNGPLKNSLRLLIKERDVEANVKLLGAKTQDEVKEYLETADIFLAPSITSKKGDKEGIPVSIMEAMAMELPIVTTKHSGIHELVQDSISGFLVNEKDINALEEKILYLIENPDVSRVIGKQGRNFVEENYNINRLNNKLEKIFLNQKKKH